MNHSERLIRDFCDLNRLGDAESIARGAPLDVNGITCSVTRSRHDEADTVVVYCEFGTVPLGREAAVYEELLAQSFIGSPEGGVVFGFSPVARHVICMQTLSAAEINAKRLSDILQHMADKAGEWRQTYFLKPGGGGRPGEGVGSPLTARAVLGSRALIAPKAPR